jgi:2-keto-3-deoxy-L-rhamnonate aldolase RhmA
MNNLKDKTRSGEAVHGCFINLGSPVSAEIVGNAGFDWVLIDLEHGAGNDAIMYQQLQALAHTGATPIIRTAELSRPRVQRILDAGGKGVMFPQIQNPAEAALAVSMLYYPPKGIRGMAKMVRATGFGRNVNDYITSLDKNLIGVIQIETLGALKQIDAIAALNDVDVLFVGPTDLSLVLGNLSQFDHPSYQQAIKDVAQAAKKYGKAAGVLLQDISEYEMYYQVGYRFLACGADSAFVARSSDEMARRMREKREQK